MTYDLWQSKSPDGNIMIKILNQGIEGDTFGRTLRCISALDEAKQKLLSQVHPALNKVKQELFSQINLTHDTLKSPDPPDAPKKHQLVSVGWIKEENHSKISYGNSGLKEESRPCPEATLQETNPEIIYSGCREFVHCFWDSTHSARKARCVTCNDTGHYEEQCHLRDRSHPTRITICLNCGELDRRFKDTIGSAREEQCPICGRKDRYQ